MGLGPNLLGTTPVLESSDEFEGMPKVELSDEDMADAKGIAVARLVSYKELNNNLQDNRYIDDVGKKGAEDIYTLGTEGEKAYSVATGADIDRRFTKSGDRDHDFQVNGVVIETKTTRRDRADLLVRNDRIEAGKYDDVDVFLLVYKVSDRQYCFVGYATFDEVVSVKPKVEPNDILNHVIPWTDLHREPYGEVV